VAQNSPQKPAYGLYTEKLSGTAFTVPRADNQQTWLYRILPSAAHSKFEPLFAEELKQKLASDSQLQYTPDQVRFDPFDIEDSVDWIGGSRLVAGSGDPKTKTGLAIYVISAGKDMAARQAYYSADGDLLIVPNQGVLDLQTELGRLRVRPNEIAVVPRGIRYRVTLPDGPIRAFALELYQGHFKLPDLGIIGSNGLANARDFQVPVAAYEEDYDSDWSVVARFNGELFKVHQTHSPFDVVAWHGLYYPFKYDLGRFNSIGSVSYDHIDPSIYTVLTAPSDSPGVAVADFVFFPPRWLVMEDTFRPPWYHRNAMAEFSGLIDPGLKTPKVEGLTLGGIQIHNVMSGHGSDSQLFEAASNEKLVPVKEGTKIKAFMFETSSVLGITQWALVDSGTLQRDYQKSKWQPLKVHFKKPA